MNQRIKHITLAIDLSMNSPGFAVVGVFEGQPIVLEASVIKTDTSKGHGYRLSQIELEISKYLKKYDVEYIVREKGFSRFANTTQTLFKVVGISDLLAHNITGIEVEEIPPTTVKKILTGSGKSSKEEVAEAVFMKFLIENTEEYFTKKGKLIDDKTDACAVGYAYLKNKNKIKG